MSTTEPKDIGSEKIDDKFLIGWCEWCELNALGIPAIKAKIDTGARTSALHAFNIKPFVKNAVDYVQFEIHPIQYNDQVIVKCAAPIIDERAIMSSNGHREHRYVISSLLTLAGRSWEIELTLSNRDPLQFRMLLGRTALAHQTIIDPGSMLHQGKMTKRALLNLYR